MASGHPGIAGHARDVGAPAAAQARGQGAWLRQLYRLSKYGYGVNEREKEKKA